jgi:hypothetical protein
MTGSTATTHVDAAISRSQALLREADLIVHNRDWEELRQKLNAARCEIEHVVDDLDRSMDILIADNQLPDDLYPEQ